MDRKEITKNELLIQLRYAANWEKFADKQELDTLSYSEAKEAALNRIADVFMMEDAPIISDPKGIMNMKSMRLDSKEGDKVSTDKERMGWGYEGDKTKAAQYLIDGGAYTVDKMRVYDFSSSVMLKEFPNEWFNTVHFFNLI